MFPFDLSVWNISISESRGGEGRGGIWLLKLRDNHIICEWLALG